MAEFSRLIPREVFDEEAGQLVSQSTSELHTAVREVVTLHQSVKAVNGHIGEVYLQKSDVGLGNVANLTPAQLPLSDAATQALAGKQSATDPIPQSRITGLESALTARVQSVNGNLPDETGNVQLQLTSGAYMPTWEGEVLDQEIPVYLKPASSAGAWTHRPLESMLSGRLVPGPANDGSDDGKWAKVVSGVWTIAQLPPPPDPAQLLPAVTSADNTKTLTVNNGAWVATPAIDASKLLPTPVAADVGKVMQVQSDGTFAMSELHLRSPNGTVYKLTVSDAGALSATAV